MSRWLVTGAGGMLGRDLVDVIGTRPGLRVSAMDRSALDITDPTAVAVAVDGHQLVVNAAAWTNVDGAEVAEDQATLINGTAVAHLASACADAGAVLVHVSTDYVFSGVSKGPYPEDAPIAPVNAYGRGKAIGEQAVAQLLPEAGYVVRTEWLYGEHGSNFVSTVLRLAAERAHVDVVDDQWGQPTWSYALAKQLVELGTAALAGTAAAGIYHGSAAGQTTWCGLARAVFEAAGLDPRRVRACTTQDFPRPAARPAYSVLGHDAWATAGLTPMADWRLSLAEALTRPAFAALTEAARAASSV